MCNVSGYGQFNRTRSCLFNDGTYELLGDSLDCGGWCLKSLLRWSNTQDIFEPIAIHRTSSDICCYILETSYAFRWRHTSDILLTVFLWSRRAPLSTMCVAYKIRDSQYVARLPRNASELFLIFASINFTSEKVIHLLLWKQGVRLYSLYRQKIGTHLIS